MYLSDDAKIIIFKFIMLLAGVVLGRKRGWLVGLIYSLLSFIISMMVLVVMMVIFWWRPSDIICFSFPVVSFIIALLVPAKKKSKYTYEKTKCLSCMNIVNYKTDRCPHCGSDMSPGKVWQKKY
ncbi:hypothetical protein [Pseudescherichia sp.]|uniref:hypothetical protein n=1 Tax=Pseudescherichia sp. TaxID=2055881 RepID=UPI0028A21A17|nr:hypothetical protein [Pseudescherichia sp.]